MTDLKNKFENTKDKVIGKTKEALGKVTGNEETELKGKILVKRADMNEKFQSQKEDINEKFEGAGEKILGKINDKLDEKEENKRNK